METISVGTVVKLGCDFCGHLFRFAWRVGVESRLACKKCGDAMKGTAAWKIKVQRNTNEEDDRALGAAL